MKRAVTIMLAMVLGVSVLSGCSEIWYDGPLSCISHVNENGVVLSLMDMTEDSQAQLLAVLNSGEWVEDMPNCGYDYEMKTENETICYHSACGIFTDMTHQRALPLSDGQRAEINRILGAVPDPTHETYEIHETDENCMESPFGMLADKDVRAVEVSSIPEGYRCAFDGTSAKEAVDYMASLCLIPDFPENPDEYSGMTWDISIEYHDGTKETVYLFGDFIRISGSPWYKMNRDEADSFSTRLWELSVQETGRDE